MSDNSDASYQLILLWVMIIVVSVGAGLYHAFVTSECERKHCATGSPMLVRDQSKFNASSECVCAERAR